MQPANEATVVRLPPGTLDGLEARRAEELERRRAKDQAATASNEPRAAAPRRLAPGRKRAVVPPQSAPARPASDLPIAVESGARDDDFAEPLGGRDGPAENDTPTAGRRNVADWTAREHATAVTKSKPAVDSETESVSEEAPREYHGEIDSVASSENGDEDGSQQVEGEEESDGFIIQTEETVPLDPPPPTLPLVLVDIEGACGCAPDDDEDKTLMMATIRRMLLGGSDGGEAGPASGEESGDGLSLDFDAKVQELFDAGVAFHVDSGSDVASSCRKSGKDGKVVPLDVMPYPEYLSSSETGSSSRSTKRIWKVLHSSPRSDLPVLDRLLTHLRNTSRSLTWKADMHLELSLMARREHNAKIRRERAAEVAEWRDRVRRERLEKLYEVRETFEVQVGSARRKHERLAGEREARVEREMERRGLSRRPPRPVSDVGRTPLSEPSPPDEYDDDGWGGYIEEEEVVGDEAYDVTIASFAGEGDEEDQGPDREEEWAPVGTDSVPLGMNISVDAAIGSPTVEAESPAAETIIEEDVKTPGRREGGAKGSGLEPISRDDNTRRKAERRRRLDRRRTAGDESDLRRQEEAIRESLRTNDERVAEALLRKLEERLQGVDDLLESLQEEEWADEESDEDGENGPGKSPDDKAATEDTAGDDPLLDQILCMILGSLSKYATGAEDDRAHYARVREEHVSIVKQWKETFGRLPPSEEDEPPVEAEPSLPESEMPFGDGFGAGGRQARSVTWEDSDAGESRKARAREALRLIDNSDGNWDDIDWDDMPG